MKSISGALQAHLDSGQTTLALCVKLTRKDGQIFGFTEHDRPLVVDGVTYTPTTGVDTSAVDTGSGLNVDTLEMRGFLDALGVSEADISAGRWDGADVRVFAVNWADVTMGTYKHRRGWMGEVSVTNDFRAELRGVAQKLQQTIIELATELCKADLFDARCKIVDTEGVWKFTGLTIASVTQAQREFTAAGAVGSQAAGFFTNGRVLFTTGNCAGLDMEAKLHTVGPGKILLTEAMPYVFNVGDAFTIWAGCRKRYAEDCGTKFSNKINFRGFPHLPGLDAVLKGPNR